MYYSELESSLWAPQLTPEFGWAESSRAWGDSAIHVLVVFPVNATVKMVSLSHSSIYSIVRSLYPIEDVYVDICFLPPPYQSQSYSKKYPFLLGALSKRSWHDFDIVMPSISVMWMDTINFYQMLVQSDFPLYSRDRLSDPYTPLVVCGGTSSGISSGLDNIVDLYGYGYGERLFERLFKLALKYQSQGGVRKFKFDLVKDLCQFTGFCYPGAYKEHWSIQDGRVICEGYDHLPEFPAIVTPDTLIDLESYGHLYDNPPVWSMPGYISKAQIFATYSCQSAGSCNFCAESWMGGVYQERSYESLVKALRHIKQSNMDDKACFQSFNSNFISRFPDLMTELYNYFDRLSIINFRISGLANSIRAGGPDNNYVALVRALGSNTIAGACEGINQRMRNFFNKQLTFDDILLTFTEVFKQRFLQLKVGCIRSGFERKSDIDDMVKEWKEILAVKDSLGSSTLTRINLTTLIHEHCTPCEMLPRVMSYRAYMSSIDPSYYSYDFLPLSDLGVRIQARNDTYSIYMQQLQCDLPAQLIEDSIFKTSLGLDKMTTAHGKLCNDYLASQGIDLKKQFLEYDYTKGVHQYLKGSCGQDLFRKVGLDWFKSEHRGCVKTVDSIVSGQEPPSCYGCTACSTLSKEMTYSRGVPVDYKKWIKTRPVQTKFNLMDVRDAKLQNEPSFYYRLIFSISESAKYSAKEGLVRAWLGALARVNDKWVTGFRKIAWAGFRNMDNEGFYSTYYGYEAATIGTTLQFNPSDFNDFKKANDLCPNIKLITYQQLYESCKSCGPVRYLVELKLNLPQSQFSKVLDVFTSGEFNVYKQTVGLSESVSCSISYKFVPSPTGYVLYLLMPPKFSPVLTLMKKFTYSKLIDLLVSCKVVGVYAGVKGSSLYEDLVHNRVTEISGFTEVSVQDSADTEEDERLEVEGA